MVNDRCQCQVAGLGMLGLPVFGKKCLVGGGLDFPASWALQPEVEPLVESEGQVRSQDS
jgi:hypothetical protein